ncbi:hypothetical protein ACJX0J_006705, partial [Zea mays]
MFFVFFSIYECHDMFMFQLGEKRYVVVKRLLRRAKVKILHRGSYGQNIYIDSVGLSEFNYKPNHIFCDVKKNNIHFILHHGASEELYVADNLLPSTFLSKAACPTASSADQAHFQL